MKYMMVFGARVSTLVAVALLAGCASTTGRRTGDVFTGTCGPPTAQALPPASIAGSIWRQPGASENVAARAGAVSLDVAQSQYRAYFNTIRERIRSKWVYPRPAGERGIEGNLVIDFYIANDGHLEHVQLTRSSGSVGLDDAALTAVKLAQPFPPVPDGLCKETLGITGAFRYEIKRGMFLIRIRRAQRGGLSIEGGPSLSGDRRAARSTR